LFGVRKPLALKAPYALYALLRSPTISKIEVLRSAKVRRAKLYFLRDLKGKAARMKEVKKTS